MHISTHRILNKLGEPLLHGSASLGPDEHVYHGQPSARPKQLLQQGFAQESSRSGYQDDRVGVERLNDGTAALGIVISHCRCHGRRHRGRRRRGVEFLFWI